MTFTVENFRKTRFVAGHFCSFGPNLSMSFSFWLTSTMRLIRIAPLGKILDYEENKEMICLFGISCSQFELQRIDCSNSRWIFAKSGKNRVTGKQHSIDYCQHNTRMHIREALTVMRFVCNYQFVWLKAGFNKVTPGVADGICSCPLSWSKIGTALAT